MNKYILSIILYFLVYGNIISQSVLTGASNDQNYILEATPRIEIKSGENITVDNSNVVIDYQDGYGNHKQTVLRKTTPLKSDLIIDAVVKDHSSLNLIEYTYLPTPIENGQGTFYETFALRNKAQSFYQNDKPYTTNIREYSSGTPRTAYVPGTEWQNNPINYSYTYTSESVKKFTVNLSANNTYVLKMTGSYPTINCLLQSLVIDEDGKKSVVFTDHLERVILTRKIDESSKSPSFKYYDTYYVYNDENMLCMVLPPLAADAISKINVDYVESEKALNDYAYIYKYDGYKRCISKKLPGCRWIYYLNDRHGRTIFSQDGEQRPKKEWTFNIPDIFGRTAIVGTCKTINNLEISNITIYLDGIIYAKYNKGKNKGYSIYIRRTNGIESPYELSDDATVISANYYDNYSFMNDMQVNYQNLEYIEKEGYDKRYAENPESTKGLLTGMFIGVLEGDKSLKDQYKSLYYDQKGQLIQTVSTNHIGGIDKTFMAYNFSGQPVKQYVQHSGSFLFNINELTEDYTYAYDHAGRLKTTTRNGVVIESLTYNELGQIEGKKQGTSFDSQFKYNIRGWITQQKDNGGSKFQMDLKYQDHPSSAYKAYNGNISQMNYSYGGKVTQADYSYDKLNRLTAAYYNSWTNHEFIGYDKNGNIRSIERATDGNGIDWHTDMLDITCDGNQLKSVYNLASDINGSKVVEYPAETATFTYNANGALTSDSGRGIDSIKYNLLNLPQRIKFNNGNLIEYSYSASGERLQAKYTTKTEPVTQPINGSLIEPFILTEPEVRTTDYVGNILLESGTSMLITNVKMTMLFNGGYEEYRGRSARPGQAKYTQKTYFHLKDYLGNIRDVKTEGSSDIVQRTEYLPFGTPFKQEVGDAGAQRYKFGGKEFDQMHGLNMLDFHARQYDPLLGRFHTVDPLAEMYYSTSPYVYCLNNPIRGIDPTGKLVIFINGWHGGSGGKAEYWDGLDKAVMKHLGDNKAMYLDGSVGGQVANEINSYTRQRYGYRRGEREAYNVISSLKDNETIKIITHSMGGSYGKGFVHALVDYCKKHGIDPSSIIEFEADFAPFNPGQQKAVKGIPTYQYAHTNDLVAGSKKIKGVSFYDSSKHDNKTLDPLEPHYITSFWDQVKNLPAGEYKVENGKIVSN